MYDDESGSIGEDAAITENQMRKSLGLGEPKIKVLEIFMSEEELRNKLPVGKVAVAGKRKGLLHLHSDRPLDPSEEDVKFHLSGAKMIFGEKNVVLVES